MKSANIYDAFGGSDKKSKKDKKKSGDDDKNSKNSSKTDVKKIKTTMETAYFIPLDAQAVVVGLPVVTVPEDPVNGSVVGIPSFRTFPPKSNAISYDKTIYTHKPGNVAGYLTEELVDTNNTGGCIVVNRSVLRAILELLNAPRSGNAVNFRVHQEGNVCCIDNLTTYDPTERRFGFNFEKIMTGGGDGHRPHYSQVVSFSLPFFPVSHTANVNHEPIRVFVGCETDCVDPETGLSVELKTVLEGVEPHYREIWMQMAVSGCDKLVIGTVSREASPTFSLETVDLNELQDRAFGDNQVECLRLFHALSRVVSCLVRKYRDHRVRLYRNETLNRLEIVIVHPHDPAQQDSDEFEVVGNHHVTHNFVEMN